VLVLKKIPRLDLLVFIARQHTDIAILSVRLSVRDIPVSDENGLTCRHSCPPYGSPIILVLPAPNIFAKFRGGSPRAGALNTGGV